MSTRLATERLRSEALLLRRIAYGEADDIVHLFTKETGLVAAIARGGRRSTRRFAALEPMHELSVTLEISPARELARLTEALVSKPRLGLSARLATIEAAGVALRWLRRAASQRTPEPALWVEMTGLLDGLDALGRDEDPKPLVAATGLRMLSALGWGLELARCVRCGKPCPENARAMVDVDAGGLVCRACGGPEYPTTRARWVPARQRLAMIAALGGAPFTESPGPALQLIERALEVHGRGDAT